MPEENGSGRLDRIERMMDRWAADHERIRSEHEEFRRDLQQLLTAQVLQKDEIDKLAATAKDHTRQLELQRELQREDHKYFDERVDKLVIAIGEFIRSRPNVQP